MYYTEATNIAAIILKELIVVELQELTEGYLLEELTADIIHAQPTAGIKRSN